jgi:hypothetical protein
VGVLNIRVIYKFPLNKLKITVSPLSDAFFNAFLIEFRTIYYHDAHSVTNIPIQLLRIGQ